MQFSGSVYYSPNSCAADIWVDTPITGSGQYETITLLAQQPIPDIPIVLISLAEGEETYFAYVKTDNAGQYSFTNVAPGTYKVIEAFGMDTQYVPSTIDFETNKRLVTKTLVPKDPSVEYILTLRYEAFGANRIISLYPNTRFIEVNESQIIDQEGGGEITSVDFKDAPQRCEPLAISDFLQFQNAVIKGDNLIQYVDNGTFGSAAPGSAASSNYIQEYAAEDFTDFDRMQYTSTGPEENECAITNTAASGSLSQSWFDTADYTAGDETGRFMIVNGGNVEKAFFKSNVSIESGTAYLFSWWAMNIVRFPESMNPGFSMRILDAQTSEEIFYKEFNREYPMEVTSIPTWIQIGAILTAEQLQGTSDIVIEFISEAGGAVGNDYAIDDVSVYALKRGVVAEKATEGDIQEVELGKEITYICTFNNLNDEEAITHVLFKDFVQEGLTIKDNRLFLSSSDIVDYPIYMGDILDPVASLDGAGIDIGKSLAEAVTETDPNYVPFKLEKIPPNVPVTVKFTAVVNAVNKTEPYSNVKNRYRVQFLMETDQQDTSRPRMVASNEVVTPVIYPDLKVQKGISKMKNGQYVEMEQGEWVYADSKVYYSVQLTNSGKAQVNGLKLTDAFDERFEYEFPSQQPCPIKVTTQITSPESMVQSAEQQVACEDITPFGTHGIEVSNISVPAAAEEEKGICIVRIYGSIKAI